MSQREEKTSKRPLTIWGQSMVQSQDWGRLAGPRSLSPLVTEQLDRWPAPNQFLEEVAVKWVQCPDKIK